MLISSYNYKSAQSQLFDLQADKYNYYELRTIEKIKRGLFIVILFFCTTTLLAQKYWVDGEGKWNDASHWSNTSGGSGGASVPTISDDVVFDGNSGFSHNSSIELDRFSYAKNISFIGFSESVKIVSDTTSSFFISGKINIPSNVENKIVGSVGMLGTNSDYKYKKFNVGEFYGKQGFIDVYKDLRESEAPLVVSDVDTFITDATCGCNGSITVSPNDGTGPFVYDWYPKLVNGDPIVGDGTQTVSDLCPGLYTVVIYDGIDPFIVANIPVQGPAPLTISLTPPIDSVDCNGGSDGEIVALVFGGVRPYTYTWDDPTAQANYTTLFLPPSSERVTVPSLPAGNYSLSITDDVGCTENGPTWTVEEPTELTSSITDTTHVFCFSDCTGDATVTPSGGTPGFTGYTYNWYNAPGTPTTPQATNLCQGTYNVEVTDGKGCLDTISIDITQPTLLNAIISGYTDVQCNRNIDGTATAGVSGGTFPYSYDWYNVPGNPTVNSISGLDTGTYNVEITDLVGCLEYHRDMRNLYWFLVRMV